MIRRFEFNKILSITLLSSLLTSMAFGQFMADRFKKLNTEEGLPAITAIITDSKGFMWFGTVNGLYRFDGYRFKLYESRDDDQSTLASNTIHKLFIDDEGVFWVITRAGLCQYNPKLDKFERINIKGMSPELDIRDSLYLSEGHYLFATYGHGLFKVNLASRQTLENIVPVNFTKPNKFPEIKRTPNEYLKTSGVYKIFRDSKGEIWFGTYDGITRFNPQTDVWHHTKVGQGNQNAVLNIIELENGQMWTISFVGIAKYDKEDNTFEPLFSDERVYIATNIGNSFFYSTDSGLHLYDAETGKTQTFIPDPEDDYTISGNYITTISIKNDEVWFGTLSKGLMIWKLGQQKVRRYSKRTTMNGLQSNLINGVTDLPTGELVIFSDKGLDLLDIDDNIVRRFVIGKNNLKRPSTLLGDSKGTLWLGGIAGLQYIENPLDSQSAKVLDHRDTTEDTVRGHILDMLEDEAQTLWIASNKGLFRKSSSQTGFTNVLAARQTLEQFVRIIRNGQNNHIWVSTKSGLEKIHKSSLHTSHKIPVDFHEQLQQVNDIAESPIHLFVASDNGLLVLNGDYSRSQVLNATNTLNTDVTKSLQLTASHLWVGTDKGIVRLSLDLQEVSFFNVFDGLQSKTFNDTSFKDRNDKLYFGGTKGLTSFSPSFLKATQTKPQINISGFMMFNKEVPLKNEDPTSPLESDITETKSIRLNYKNTMISFDFGLLDPWGSPMKAIQYSMENFEDEWITADHNSPNATFTNLHSGTYNLRVKGTIDGKIWDDAPTIQITMTPPPWASIPAYFTYTCLVLYVIYLYIRSQRRKLETQRRINREQQRVNQRLRQLDKFKDEILANTSHELRTPLNGIIGLADSLRDGSSGEMSEAARKDLNSIVNCGKRLNSLINDILDYSKLKNKTLEMHRSQVDFHDLTDQVLKLSRPLTSQKKIALINEVPANFPRFPADENRLRQILHNLIGNAIKFTPAGQISIKAQDKDNEVAISVADTGIGIPQNRLEQIFEAFEQADTSAERDFGGTGLGLAITRRLVNLHGGSIKVSSAVGQGTTFTFTLPKEVEEDLSAAEPPSTPIVKEEPKPEKISLDAYFDEAEEQEEAPPVPKAFAAKGKGHILIVDDEPVNRKVLLNYLTPQGYNLTEVGSGQEAVDLVEKGITFDLILLDIMMPRMSGYDVCRAIRKKFSPNELPILFLSAKNQTGDLLEGFYAGANDYLAKPIAKPELLARVNTHLELLDVNRHLEQKVEERTVELRDKNQKILEQKQELIAKQRQLVMQEKMASIGTLTAGIAHEINNPVNFAHGSVQNLVADLDRFKAFFFDLAGPDADEEIVEAFTDKMKPLFDHSETIIEGTKRISGIVRELQTFSRMDEAKVKKADLVEGIRSTISLVKSSFADRVLFDLHLADPVVMECWPAEMNQVFMNLTVNACQAITYKQNENGKPNGERLSISSKVKGKTATITFKDDGCGIPDHVRDRIFEPFYTTKPVGEGTGLGLSISYEIIQKHKGQLEVESEKGKGTTFIITLPTDLSLSEGNDEEEKKVEEFLSN